MRACPTQLQREKSQNYVISFIPDPGFGLCVALVFFLVLPDPGFGFPDPGFGLGVPARCALHLLGVGLVDGAVLHPEFFERGFVVE